MNNVKQMGLLVMLLAGGLLTACARAEPTVPPRHEMPPLETAVIDQTFLPVTHSLLEPTDLGDGWRGAACPLSQPVFCLYQGESELATASLSFEVYALARNQMMQGLLQAEGLSIGYVPRPDDADYVASARAILTNLAETNFNAAAETAPADHLVLPLAWEPVAIGPLPGLAVGHQVQTESGELVAYDRYYVAFDDSGLYWFALSHAETAVMSDVETAAVALLSNLRLPPPVLPTETEKVRVEMKVSLTAVHGEGFIQHLYGGELLDVRGLSEDGNWWLVECPAQVLAGTCWLPNYTGLVRPR